MHCFTGNTSRGLRAALFTLAGFALPACPMDGEQTETSTDPGETTESPDATTGDATTETPDATTGAPDATTDVPDATTDVPDATTGDATTEVPDATTGDATTGDAATYSLSGTVGRSVDIARGNDGVGLLLIAAFADCGLGQQPIAVTAVPNADLSAADAKVPFMLTGLPAGPVHVALFLDDNGDADPMAPLPHDGDLVYGFDACDGELDCVPLEIADADLEGVELDLNLLEVDECP